MLRDILAIAQVAIGLLATLALWSFVTGRWVGRHDEETRLRLLDTTPRPANVSLDTITARSDQHVRDIETLYRRHDETEKRLGRGAETIVRLDERIKALETRLEDGSSEMSRVAGMAQKACGEVNILRQEMSELRRSGKGTP